MQKSNLISHVLGKAPCITVLKNIEKSDENKDPPQLPWICGWIFAMERGFCAISEVRGGNPGSFSIKQIPKNNKTNTNKKLHNFKMP